MNAPALPKTSAGPVLVAGGGIGGLMTALTLARSGYAVHLLEQAGKFEEAGAGVQLGPNATRILQEWNLLENLGTTLVRPDEVRILDAVQDRLVGRMPLGETVRDRFGAPYAVIHRGDLHTALLDACLAEAGITIETGQTIAGYEQSSNVVELQTDEGRKISGAALVGADGLWSTVRRQMLSDDTPDYAGHTAYRALVEPAAMPAHCTANATTLWAGPGMHLVHYPVSGGRRHNVVAICENTWRDDGWHGTGAREEVVLQFKHCCDRLIGILEASPDYGKWALADRPPARIWSDGRVTLLGDAAHPVLPYLAQGAAMAIEDAHILARCLQDTGGHFETAFGNYQTTRQPRTARLYRESRRQGSIYHARGVKRFARNQVMKRLTAEQWYKRVKWIYDGP